MRVIVCGAGQVGYNIAFYLASEGNNVTIIDNNPQLVAQINSQMNLSAIAGQASNPEVLRAAGADEADMIIAVTRIDEVNMTACQVAHSLFNIPKKIARIREQSFLQPQWSGLFSKTHMPIDVIISPEIVIAEEVRLRLAVPGTTFVSPLADGKVYAVGVVCTAQCPLLHTAFDQIPQLFPDLSFRILVVLRNNQPFIPDEKSQIFEDDEVFFCADTKHLKRVMAAFGHEEKEARKLVIAGGGNVGYGLIKMLQEKGRGIHLRVIEHNRERAQFLAENLNDILVLNGSCLGKEILQESAVGEAETFIAVTNDDETNILGSLLAKQYGCKRVVTLVNNPAYGPMVGPMGIDSLVFPRTTIAATIMQHIRKGRIRSIHSVRDGFAEIIEAEVKESSSMEHVAIKDLSLPEESVVGAVVRGAHVIMPGPEFVLDQDDQIIVLSLQSQARKTEKILSSQSDLL